MEIKALGKKYKPGNPMTQNLFPMGQDICENVMILYVPKDNKVKSMEVVNCDTGETIEITL